VSGLPSRRSRSGETRGQGTNHETSEAWRYKGIFTRYNRFKGAFPGLGIATVAFAAYCGYEYMFLKDDHHAEGHGEDHH
jgi:NADH dehydrogenase (ubiquinone) 1 beta subcomplex subunit 3